MRRTISLLRVGAIAAAAAFSVLATTATAQASEAEAPGWEITASTLPTHLPPSGHGVIKINLYNTGATPSSGPITVTDTLPAGVHATAAGDYTEFVGGGRGFDWSCTVGTVVTCISDTEESPSIATGELQSIGIGVDATGGAGEETNAVTVSGGEALSSASTTDQVVINATPAAFGLSGFDAWLSNADGTTDTQAGSHPYGVSVSFTLNSGGDVVAPEEPSGNVRDLDVNLPRGLVGNPNAVPQCSRQLLDAKACPASTQVGLDTADLAGEERHFSIYNIVPPKGVPAQFAFTLIGITAFIDFGAKEGEGGSVGDYGLTADADNIPERGIVENTATIWGVPAASSHDAQRTGPGCGGGCASTVPARPLISLPTACSGPGTFAVTASPWGEGSTDRTSIQTHDSNGTASGFTGCDQHGFGPSISLAPNTTTTDSATGLEVNLEEPQEGLESATGFASSDLKSTTVELPPGLVVNPGQAAGLEACEPQEANLGEKGPAACPSGSEIGHVTIQTPLLSDKPEGELYLLRSNPPNLEVLIAASADGVNLKLVGHVHLDETTGQVSATFTETPELPFNDLKLSFNGAPRAALVTPAQCGTFTTGVDFTPWASPFIPDTSPQSSFILGGGPNGSACPSGALPFAPSLSAGSASAQAGGYTEFSLLLQRGDGQQRLSSLGFSLPPGLLGMITNVPRCPEPQASLGQCPGESQIGHTVVQAGPGSNPLVVPQPGGPEAPIYLTGPYNGAPYGLSIAVPAIAGPFNLGTVVVRASIAIDPHTAQATVTTGPIPTILDGVPIDLRTVDAVIDRGNFLFNPTDCKAMSLAGSAQSTEGASAPIASRFQVGACQGLGFKPAFTVSTSGKTSKAAGASLTAKITYPKAPAGSGQASAAANIAAVKVDLPKQLPSRLTTLQKACLAKVFEANPAGCPKTAVVGHATVYTPVLPVPLTGPAYFVSHGNEAFPSLTLVLQGEGVTIELVGATHISKGITSTTFKTVPDVPFTTFELALPEGPYSALTAYGNLCKSKLAMPTDFVAQNGLELRQSTKIQVNACPKAKAKKTTKRKAKKGKK